MLKRNSASLKDGGLLGYALSRACTGVCKLDSLHQLATSGTVRKVHEVGNSHLHFKLAGFGFRALGLVWAGRALGWPYCKVHDHPFYVPNIIQV